MNFGYTTKGGSSLVTGKFFASRFICPDAGILNSVSVYLKNASGSAQNIQIGIYNDAAGAIGTALIYSATLSLPIGFDDWRTVALAGNLLLGGAYWLTVQLENSASIVYIYYDAGAEGQGAFKAAWTFGDWTDNPAGLTYSTNKISISANYTYVNPNAFSWFQMPKSQIDPEMVEQAIVRLILEHSEDEEAHLGAGQSLQSHKVSEIIDHVVASIIADKIKDGEITRFKLDPAAVVFTTEDFDKGMVFDFVDFSSSATGSASIEKKYRTNRVKTGNTQNSVAQVYTEFDEVGPYWNCPHDLEIGINYYFGEDWNWETVPGGEIYVKYGMGLNADMGLATDKCFGIKFEDQASGYIKATGFARVSATLQTVTLATDLNMAAQYIFIIRKTGSLFEFFIDGVKKGEVAVAIIGTVSTPYLTHVAKNPVNGSAADGSLNQFSYYFPY